jgi:hypothetical protein
MSVTTAIFGGLGNQMFQYTAGRALSIRLGVPLKLDLSWFSTIAKNDSTRPYMIGAFPSINVETALKHGLFSRLLRRFFRQKIGYVPEPGYAYWEGFQRITDPAYLYGYWQNEMYFNTITDLIRKDFTFPPLPSSEAEKIAARINDTDNAVAVHIRRGDYVSNASTHGFHGLCSQEYYTNAFKTIAARCASRLELFIFSDDSIWVRENFDTQGLSATVIDFPEHLSAPWHDMHLMTLCRHHIIANSSFSWWGAWLSNGDGIVIAPKRWFAEETMKHCNPSVSSWIKI